MLTACSLAKTSAPTIEQLATADSHIFVWQACSVALQHGKAMRQAWQRTVAGTNESECVTVLRCAVQLGPGYVLIIMTTAVSFNDCMFCQLSSGP